MAITKPAPRALPPSRPARAFADQAPHCGALLALRQLLAMLPLPNSTLADMCRHERDHAIMTAERGLAAAEAAMWNVYAFEHWRRHEGRP